MTSRYEPLSATADLDIRVHAFRAVAEELAELARDNMGGVVVEGKLRMMIYENDPTILELILRALYNERMKKREAMNHDEKRQG